VYATIGSPNQNGCLATESEVRVLGDRGSEHRRDSRIDGIATPVEHAHGSFGGEIRSGCNGSPGPANGVSDGPFGALAFPLRGRKKSATDQGAEKDHCRLTPHLFIVAL
jgi:hypothetical protein